MKRALLILLGGFVLASCGTPKPRPDPGPFAADAGTVDPSCAGICEEAFRKGCAWAAPTLGGATCLDVCFTATSGGPIVWDLVCRARAVRQSCDAVDACP